MSNVKVAVRVRPINKREIEQNGKIIVDTNGDTVSVTNLKVDNQSEYGDSRERVKSFTFDYCYDSTGDPRSPRYAPQQQVFQDLGTEILQAAFEGYNACVFAYGQTSTGKTYTMTGVQDDPGLIPRICEGLFSHVDDFEATDITFQINISYLEIYNERVRDLLQPSLSRKSEKYTLKVREHPKEGTYVHDLSSHIVKDNEQIQTLIDKGNESRTTAATYMHDHSSRSHAIVTVNFIQAKLEDNLPHEIVSKIHLVDLAGSERADPNWSLNYKGRLKEGSNINKSLVTLGNVIKALAEKSILSWSTDSLGSTQSFSSSGGGEGRASPYCSPKRLRLPYIPYRDSVLTWLLKDSLGGNSKTIMIATVSPASIYYNETISTLRYAQRAKNILNKPKINEDASVTLIRELRQEIDRLKQLLAGTQTGFFPHGDVMYVVPIQKSQAEHGGAVFSLPDSGDTLQKELQLQEDRANKLTQTWMDKWMETHEIIKESDLSITGLSKKASSMGVLIDSQMPHLVGMDNDILSTGVVIYHLKEGKTLVGREDAKREQDIVLSGPAVQREHCYFKNVNGSVTLYPNRGSLCTVNGLDCKGPTLLKQGDSVILGKTQMFRFNNPAEAAVLRERRQSRESILEESVESSEDSGFNQHRAVQNTRLRSLQLESQYQTEAEKIERAKEELERLKQEHIRAEELRQMKEEELWKTHDQHLHEIEEEKKRLTKLKEETFLQRQKAEQELQYARECLDKEREAFYQQLQNELSRLSTISNQEKEVQGDTVFPEDFDSSEVIIDVIRKRKLSVEGQLKTIAQKEILKTLSHRETEKSLRKQSDDLEDEFEYSKHQIEHQLEKIREIEEYYRHTDAVHYTEINKTKEELEEIQQREEQLELYIEEKQDLLMVKSDKPRPLRTACSAEVLTDLEVETEFSQRTSSMLALNRGSVGDLPAISHQFSLSSMMSVDSQSMESDLNEQNGDSASKTKSKAKYRKISTDAKSVTDRLYQKSTPKFKYEPRHKKNTSPSVENKTKSRKGLKSDGDTPHKSKVSNSSSSEKKGRSSPNESNTTSPSNLLENQTLTKNSLSKRHVKSTASLASVPEAVGEEGDEQFMHSTPDISKVVRRRKGGNRRSFEDEFRRHSEPLGEELADAFEKYTQEMEKSVGEIATNRHNSGQDESVPCDNVNIPTIIVSNNTDIEQSNIEIYNNGTNSVQGQEFHISMDAGDRHEDFVAMEDSKGQLQCHVVMDRNVGGMECGSDSVSKKPNVDIKSGLKQRSTDIMNNNGDFNDDKCRSANFRVDLMPIINVSYSEGLAPEPVIPKSHEPCQRTLNNAGISDIDEYDFSQTEDICEVDDSNCNSDTRTEGNPHDMIRIGNKRIFKAQPVNTAVPSKLRKGEQSNYEWLVNAITNLNKEKLLVSGEDNESGQDIDVDQTDDFNEQNSDQNCDDSYVTEDIPILDNVNHENYIKLHDNNSLNWSKTEQDYLENDENKAYYSDSLDDDKDSLDGSRPSRFPENEEEDMSDSLNGSSGENNENNNVENGVMEYFSDIDPDEINEEEMIPELSDYDEVGENDVLDRAEIYIQYPTDFPGSLLYSIQEESVPASPDLSESKDISSEFIGDQTCDGVHDKFLSQVFILGQEDEAVVMKNQIKINEMNNLPLTTSNLQEEQTIDNELISEPKGLSKEQSVRTTSSIVLTADMGEIEVSPEIYHHIGSVNAENGHNNIRLDITTKSKGIVTSDIISDVELEKMPDSIQKEQTENSDSTAQLDLTNLNDQNNIQNTISLPVHQRNSHHLSSVNDQDHDMTIVDMSQYLSSVAHSIRQAVEVVTDSDIVSDRSKQNIQTPLDQITDKELQYPHVETERRNSSCTNELGLPLSEDVEYDASVDKSTDVLCDDMEGSIIQDGADKINTLSIDSRQTINDNDDVIKVEKMKRPGAKPETRTLGVSTSPDLVTVSCGDDLSSDDSLQEVQEELQVLQEALDNKLTKYTSTNGSSLSSARKATRKRAMQKRGSGICTESEDLMSDESPGSQGKSSSSRPDSASRRRRRPNTKPADRPGKKTKGLSSEEYVTSENDSIYSDESPSRNKANKKYKEEIPIEIVHSLDDCIGESTGSVSQPDALSEDSMDRNISNGYSDGDSQHDTKHKSSNVNGNYIPNLQLGDQESSEYNGNDSQQISWRSNELSEGRSSRSTSETRDASQQTDSSFPPLRSPMSTQTIGGNHSLSISPVSVWNSVDKCIKSPHGFSDGTKDKSSSGKKVVKKKQCKLSDLSYTKPDTWSADTTGLPLNIDSNNEMESGSDSEGNEVVMETETCSPATPSTSDHFFESGCMVLQAPPSGRHAPVKYEVTIKPEETSIHYNVEKTEYKTYGLCSPRGDNISIPDSININITDRTSNVSENRYETITRQQFQLNQASVDSPSGDIVSERTFRSSRELSRNRSDSNIEVTSERSATDEDEKHFIERSCENNLIDHDIEKHEYGLSPRESDTTSDYGTMIFDRRRGISAAYDSDDIDSLASYGKYFPESPGRTRSITDNNLILETMLNNGQNGVPNSYVMTENKNILSDENLSIEQLESDTTQYAGQSVDSHASHNCSKSSEDVYVSANMSRASSESLDYQTPQQSPRDNDISCENIEIPDVLDTSRPFLRKNLIEEMKMLKTVSVNTESEQRESNQSRDQIIRETLKNELQKKIDDLKHNRKSKDDSAISSDYTDGDSVTVSPRGSQLYESDKTLRIGNIRPNSVEIRTTKTDTSFEPPCGAQSYLPKLVDIDNKTVQKIPLKDSGNVFDDENSEEIMSETTEYLENVQDENNRSNTRRTKGEHTSTCIENEMFEEQEVSDGSLSPGEILSDDMYEQFASGLHSGGDSEYDTRNMIKNDQFDYPNDQVDYPNEFATSTTVNEFSDGKKSAELIEMMNSNQLMKEKSPSLSNIRDRKNVDDYRRSVSENCIDQYEENTTPNSGSSNDSIVFVFMGQSHTRESMEKLKKYTSTQKGYKVHESDDNILLQNQDRNGDDISYKDSDERMSDESMDSHEEMMANMENILAHNDTESQEVSEEIGTDSQEISEEICLDSQDISEENYIDSQENMEDDLNQTDPGETTFEEVQEKMEKPNVNSTDHGLVYQKKQYNEDDEPLRHRFGIDESILPIPTRSVSSDNLPRKISNHKTMHRSRSTSLLDVGKVEKTNTSSDNEGIFPPNIQHSAKNSQELEQKESIEYTDNIEVYEIEYIESDLPPTPVPSVVDDAGEDKGPIDQDDLYSSLFPLQTQQSQLDHNGNVEDLTVVTQRRTIENGNQSYPPMTGFTSIGIQACLADSGTQTDASVVISPDGQMVQVLPGLDSPFRAQSMQTLQGRMTQFNPSEGSETWYNLSSLMLETIPLLRTINERLPGADMSIASSTENVITIESMTLATQTTGSLEDLNTAAVQTDLDNENMLLESRLDVAVSSTQTESWNKELDSFTETFDVMPENSHETSEMSVQTDEPQIRVTETSDICLQTDFIWTTANQEPVTTSTNSLFSVQGGSVNVTHQIPSNEKMTSEKVMKVTSSTSLEEKVLTTEDNKENEDSSEEQYSDTCVMFYDFVNKCYVQSIEEVHNSEPIKKHMTSKINAQESQSLTGNQALHTSEAVSSHSTIDQDDGKIDRAVRIHPKYSEYVYKTKSKETENTPGQEATPEVSQVSLSSKDMLLSLSKEQDSTNHYNVKLSNQESSEVDNDTNLVLETKIDKHGKPLQSRSSIYNTELYRKNDLPVGHDEPSDINSIPSYRTYRNQKLAGDNFSLSSEPNSDQHREHTTNPSASGNETFSRGLYTTEPKPYRLSSSEDNNKYVRIEVSQNVHNSNNAGDKGLSSEKDTHVTEPKSFSQRYMERLANSGKMTSEQQNSLSESRPLEEEQMSIDRLSLRTLPRSYRQMYNDAEILSDKKYEPLKQEMKGKESGMIATETSVDESNLSFRTQPRSYTQKYMHAENTYKKKADDVPEQTLIPSQRPADQKTISNELFSLQSKPRSYQHNYMDEDVAIDRHIESPEEEVIEETIPLDLPADMNVVEDVVSPRRDDTVTRNYTIPVQTKIRQNTNTQTSTSSQQSNSSQSDTSQQASETGQSEHHKFQSKTIKRSKLPDKGDDDENDDDENKDGGDEVFTEQTSEHHYSKRDDTQIQTILTEREHVMETEFYVPDIEASQAEMEALKEEHNKTMEAIRKASAERKQRTDDLKKKTKQVIETEFEMTKEIENWNDEEAERRNTDNNKQVTFDMNGVETIEYSIISEENEPQSEESLTKDTSETDSIEETVHKKPTADESEKKLQQLEEMWKDYVRVEQELKKRQEEKSDRSKDLIEDVLSDTEENKQTELKSKIEPAVKPNFNEYKVQTKIDIEEPVSPITKTDKADIKFMPTYSVDYRRDRPKADKETVVKESFVKVSRSPPTLPDWKTSSVKTPMSTDLPTAAAVDITPPSGRLDKIPLVKISEKKPVMSLPRSVSVDTYSRNQGKTKSTGVEVCVDSSDDFTQTDDTVPVYEAVYNDQRIDLSSSQIKNELDRLHKERIEIIEMLALNYLPASLTVELLEAKLNYCIGQTDLLLDSLEDTWKIQEAIDLEETHHSRVVTKEYLTKYREDLRKSKNDIKICKERLDINSGKGRGRTLGRNRDLCRLRRQAEIEAFKVERQMEQQTFNSVKSINRLGPAIDQIDRKARSASPNSRKGTFPRTMTPSEHAAYLIKLRKQVVKATEQEELRHRISRSCSPYVGNRFDIECSPLPSPRSYSSYSSDMLYASPMISVSITEPIENGLRTYSLPPRSPTSPRSYSADSSFSSSYRQSYSSDTPRLHNLTNRSESYSVTSPQYNRSTSPQYNRDMSPSYNRLASHNYSRSPQTSPLHLSMEQETFSESVYSVNESQQLLREIQEARQYNKREISSAKETLQSYNRYGTNMDSQRSNGTNIDSQRSNGTNIDSQRSYRTNIDSQRSNGTNIDSQRSNGTNIDSQRSNGTNMDSQRSNGTNIDSQRSYRTNMDSQRSYRTNMDSERSYRTNMDSERSYRTNMDSERSYSQHSNSASDILDTTNLSGSYELYDERSTVTMSRSSSCRSLDRDSDSVHSNYLSPRYEHDILHTRPVRSSDIKSRIHTRKRFQRT